MSLEDWASVATIVLAAATVFLALAAIIAGIYAAEDLAVVRKRYRYDILVSLINQIADSKEKANRAIINERFKEGTSAEEIHSWIKAGREARTSPFYDSGLLGGQEVEVIEEGVPSKRTRSFKELIDTMNATEETIACFDKIGFFLLGRDAKLKEEAPDWIWTMANGMWKRLGNYVLYRQGSGDTHWGKYFRELSNESKKRLPSAT